MKLSFNEATARDCSSLEKDLILCEKAGFDFIEIRLHMLEDYLKEHTTAELKAYFDTHRIKPHAFNALYIFNKMFSDRNDEPEHEAQVMRQFDFACRMGKEIGAHYMIVVPDLDDADQNGVQYNDTPENIHNDSVRILKRLAPVAAEYDMNLCWEPVGVNSCAVKTVEQAWEIVKEVDMPNVGLALDAMNLHMYGLLNDFSAISRLPAEKIFAIHINNCDDLPLGVLSNSTDRCFCDRGAINLDSFLGNLKAAGYNGMVSIETFRQEYWDKAPEWVVQEAYRTTYDKLKSCGCL